jgi:hypothetical protein
MTNADLKKDVPEVAKWIPAYAGMIANDSHAFS